MGSVIAGARRERHRASFRPNGPRPPEERYPTDRSRRQSTFDILRWLAAKFHPSVYAEKPPTAPVQTVNVGIAISPERLAELRAKLHQSRSALALEKKTPNTRVVKARK